MESNIISYKSNLSLLKKKVLSKSDNKTNRENIDNFKSQFGDMSNSNNNLDKHTNFFDVYTCSKPNINQHLNQNFNEPKLCDKLNFKRIENINEDNYLNEVIKNEKDNYEIDTLLTDVKSNNLSLVKWTCQDCNNECIPVRKESRCLCGHRLKEHSNTDYKCQSKSCKCNNFFFIVAEGAWILRCRCKHKHIEHDPSNSKHNCIKCKNCIEFDSPWICNCGHGWKNHIQTIQLCQGIQDFYNPKKSTDYKFRRDGEL